MKQFRVGEMGVGEMGQMIGETGVGEMGEIRENVQNCCVLLSQGCKPYYRNVPHYEEYFH